MLHEALARQLSQQPMINTSLAGAFYPGLHLPLYAHAPGLMHGLPGVLPQQSLSVVTPEQPHKSPSSEEREYYTINARNRRAGYAIFS